MMRLLPQRLGLVFRLQLLVKCREAIPIIGIEPVFMTEVQIETKPFSVVLAATLRNGVFLKQRVVRREDFGRNVEHSKYLIYVYLAIWEDILLASRR
jgi:hypothetical protein